MKLVGYACIGTLVAGLAAFSLQDRPGAVLLPREPDGSEVAEAAVVADAAGADVGLRAPATFAESTRGSDEVRRVADDATGAAVAEEPDEVRNEGASSPEDRETDEAREDRSDRVDRDAADDHRRRDRRDRRRRWWDDDVSVDPADWEPPEGPVRIALQAGHWRADEAPRELSGLRGNGTRWGETLEWEVNLAIAERAGALLEEMGYAVDILPAVVPPRYRAHLFVSIHADGSNDPRASGFRVASPRRDYTGRASGMVSVLEAAYGDETGLPRVPTVTRRMRNYYAFNSRRYEHALHPMTIAVIIETGFLTSASDRRVILDDPSRAARGIVRAVTSFPETPPPRRADPEPDGS